MSDQIVGRARAAHAIAVGEMQDGLAGHCRHCRGHNVHAFDQLIQGDVLLKNPASDSIGHL